MCENSVRQKPPSGLVRMISHVKTKLTTVIKAWVVHYLTEKELSKLNLAWLNQEPEWYSVCLEEGLAFAFRLNPASGTQP
ncbi:hypothetical protein TNCT_631901 [Trichonephila clavata]|uniref:Uncharacterized protein n=1 Tax=Trichonephila clavata TaxID=2740835 RepID=A0A8X6GLW5_TRICU|nr:hypothetical protein TNCT_631901 [Trichonephila clavata]